MNHEKLDFKSPDLVSENIEKIASIFPNCVTEGLNGKTIDFDLLKQELGHSVVEGTKERYRLEWPGKKEAIVTANMPSTKTLRPVREDSVDFDNTENIYIEGDNLEVLKLLQESYLGKIKMIYIDPPYNTGKDFIYKDNFSKNSEIELFLSGQKDEYNNRLVVNPENNGRYHSDWLSMMYPRLKLSRNLLSNDGLIFISIDDNEFDNLHKILDEIYGEQNCIAVIANTNNPKGRSDDAFIATAHEYILVYGKNKAETIVAGFEPDDVIIKRYNKVDKDGFKYREIDLRKTGDSDKKIDRPDMFYYFYADPMKLDDLYVSKVPVLDSGRIEIIPLKDDDTHGRWRWGFETSRDKISLLFAKFMPSRKIWGIFEKDYLHNRSFVKATSSWSHKDVNSERGSEQMIELGFTKETFPRPKPIGTLKRIIEIGTLPNHKSIVLDFFAGSCGIVQSLFELVGSDKRDLTFITVQLPELTNEKSEAFAEGFYNICDIGKERIRRSSDKIKEDIQLEIQKRKADLVTLEKGQKSINFEQQKTEISQIILDLEDKLFNLDFGFRVYRLDTSNMEEVYYKPQDYNQSNLDLFADNIKPDRTAYDLLTQVMIDWGLQLSLKIEETNILGKKVFKVAGNSLYACFDNGIDESFAKVIAKDQPLRIVFRDSGFANDTAKINVKQLLKQLSPETEMKVI